MSWMSLKILRSLRSEARGQDRGSSLSRSTAQTIHLKRSLRSWTTRYMNLCHQTKSDKRQPMSKRFVKILTCPRRNKSSRYYSMMPRPPTTLNTTETTEIVQIQIVRTRSRLSNLTEQMWHSKELMMTTLN